MLRLCEILLLSACLSGCVVTKIVTTPLRVGGAVISAVPVVGDPIDSAVDTVADAIDVIPI